MGPRHRKRLQVIAVLAASHPAGISRERLCAWFWPEASDTKARGALRQLLHEIRTLAPGSSFASLDHAGGMVIDPAVLPSDYVRFRVALRQQDCATAVMLHTGPLLEGLESGGSEDFLDWLDSSRTEVERGVQRALVQLAREAADAGDDGLAASWQRQRAGRSPLDAAAARAYLEALERAGESARALRFFASYDERVRREIGTGADPSVAAIATRIRQRSPP